MHSQRVQVMNLYRQFDQFLSSSFSQHCPDLWELKIGLIKLLQQLSFSSKLGHMLLVYSSLISYSHYYSQHIDQDGISDCVNAVIQVNNMRQFFVKPLISSFRQYYFVCIVRAGIEVTVTGQRSQVQSISCLGNDGMGQANTVLIKESLTLCSVRGAWLLSRVPALQQTTAAYWYHSVMFQTLSRLVPGLVVLFGETFFLQISECALHLLELLL